ncbi:regulatory LuxR family protein [Litoreibacter ponti]|uniref:Regulatory LuxR family protein n=1 Tax=Litoreibacter ponti TaxID=1510457 RepID=A0A2T6BDU7_9RHOB|nr:LuxR C-terminal-related transcriptional regulator [Litoreibacter ponti]PTX54245.1 regulatory LuxR family protein [Litoreibacter ponti]
MLKSRAAFFAILALQLFCAIFFVSEIAISVLGLSVNPINWQLRELIEIGASVGLILGVVMGAVALRAIRARADHVEGQLRLASGAFAELLNERFEEWALTPAERDVALFSIKGLSLQEIATLRETSEGTVKAQTNAIYRKAGVSGRAQLLSLFVEDLMGDRLV